MLKKNRLSGFSAYPDGWPSQLIRLNGVLLFYVFCVSLRTVLEKVPYTDSIERLVFLMEMQFFSPSDVGI